MLEKFRDMNLRVTLGQTAFMVNHLEVSCDFRNQIRQAQVFDEELQSKKYHPNFSIASDGTILFQQRICVPKDDEIRKQILEEAHKSNFSVHPGTTKMYHDLKQNYWWSGMKPEIAEFVAQCLVCQQTKIEHQKPAGL